jgi:hypothetical protein
LEAPFAGIIGEAFRNELVDQYLIVNRDQFEALKLTFQCKEDPVTKSPISLEFESSDFKMLEPGDSLFKLAVKKRTKELYESLKSQEEHKFDEAAIRD